jgi:hypothetical protein
MNSGIDRCALLGGSFGKLVCRGGGRRFAYSPLSEGQLRAQRRLTRNGNSRPTVRNRLFLTLALLFTTGAAAPTTAPQDLADGSPTPLDRPMADFNIRADAWVKARMRARLVPGVGQQPDLTFLSAPSVFSTPPGSSGSNSPPPREWASGSHRAIRSADGP